MTQQKRNKAAWMLTIGMIAAGVGVLWLLFKVTPVPVPLLIALPFISYFGGMFFSDLHQRTSFTLFIAAVSVFAGIAVNMTREKQYSFYAEPYIDGKYIDKDVLIESETGDYYWETRRGYVATTKKGQRLFETLKTIITFTCLGSIAICGLIFLYTSKAADKIPKKS